LLWKKEIPSSPSPKEVYKETLPGSGCITLSLLSLGTLAKGVMKIKVPDIILPLGLLPREDTEKSCLVPATVHSCSLPGSTLVERVGARGEKCPNHRTAASDPSLLLVLTIADLYK
jgi:hypothetical protein